MKPIKLIISGFNSFIERQVIDFTSITPHGIFGIFGPTGSGKSSILDAITFSLYGKIDRGEGIREGTFVNTNCKNAFVSFSFSIKDDIYEIERMIAAKDGSYKMKSIKLMKNDEIIAQKEKEIDKVLSDEILGLTYNDFITSVVLPQGRFSEFLKATPKDRRGLIERLFDLEKYGTDLSAKIKKYKNELDNKLAYIQGEFKSFDGVDEDELKNKKDSYEKKILEREKIRKEIIIFNDEYLKAQNLWSMNNEVKDLKKQLDSLLLQNSKIDEEEYRLKEYRIVKDFLPVKKQILSETLEIEKLELNKQNGEEEISRLSETLSNTNLKFHEVSDKKLSDIPYLNKELESLEREILRLEEKETLNIKLVKLSENLKNDTLNIRNLEKQNETYTQKIENIKDELAKQEILLNENEVSEIYFKRIVKASEKEKTVNRLSKSLTENQNRLSNLKENEKRLQSELFAYEKENNDLIGILEENEKQIVKIDKEIETGKEIITSLTNENIFLNSIKDKWIKISSDIKSIDDKISNYLFKRDGLKEDLKVLEELKRANSANEAIKVLLPILKSERKCPLCGANEPFNAEIEIKDLSFDDHKYNDKIAELNDLNNLIIVNQTQMESMQEELSHISKDLISLENLIHKISDQDQKVNELKTKTTEYQNTRSEIFNKNSSLKKSYDKSMSNLHETKGRIRTTAEEIKSKEKENEDLNIEYKSNLKEYEEEQSFFQTDSLEKLMKSTIEKEARYKETRKIITKKTNSLNDLISKKHKLIEGLSEIKLSSLRTKDEIENVTKSLSEISSNLRYETKGEFNKKISEIKKEMEKIEKEYLKLSDKMKELESSKQERVAFTENLKGMISAKKSSLEASQKSLIENLNKLNLDENIEKYELSREEELHLEKKIIGFKKKHEILTQKITNLEEKIKGVTISEEEWENLNEKKESLELLKTKVEEETGALKKEIEIKTNDLLKSKELKLKIDSLGKKKEIVDEIQGITLGNRIMDFVAYQQLKYISSIASNTLSSITGTRYNIIIDDTSDFMIRDLLNGGEKRKIRSLSGGELFLTSLSMALALSSHIQLKGKMSLEFFFLDEGFGTLDKDSLEVVLRALEKIKNNNLTIGIISHIKEIQDRMPVKIMVTPANADHGSIVKIV